MDAFSDRARAQSTDPAGGRGPASDGLTGPDEAARRLVRAVEARARRGRPGARAPAPGAGRERAILGGNAEALLGRADGTVRAAASA